MWRAIIPANRGPLYRHCNIGCAHRARFSVTSSQAKPELSTRAKVTTTISTSPNRVELRPYQEDSIQAVLRYLANGEKRLGISLATGSGKTVIFSHLIGRVPPPTENATQALILAHRRELVEQAARHCRNLYPDKNVEIEMGDVHASGRADITCASIQSILSGDRLEKYDPALFKLLLVDEAHHIVARTYLDVLGHFKLIDKDKDRQGDTALIGVSATFSRSDGLRLGTAIDHIVYHKDYVDMIDDRWLADVKFTTVQSGVDLSRVRSTRGDFEIGGLSKAVNNNETNEITVRSWLAEASQRKSTLAFCVDLAHVAALTATFRAHGVDAKFITGETAVDVRARRLAAFKSGEFSVLLNCGIFTEGTDIPNIDCVLLARPTKSRNLLIQMIGRGLRKIAGKDDCHVIDMVASLERGIVTTPTLFGLDPHEIVKSEDAESMKALKSRRDREREQEAMATSVATPTNKSAAQLDRSISFTHYDNVNSLIENTSGEQHIRGLSRLAWVQVDNNRYILSDPSGSFLSIKTEAEAFVVIVTERLPKTVEKAQAPYKRPRIVATASTFEDAVHAADTYAKDRFAMMYLMNNAPWRRYPASPEQIVFLNKFREEGQKLDIGSLSKGRATDWITKLRFGARGRLKRIKSAKAKVEREVVRDERLGAEQRRAQVRVGPVES